MSDLLKGIRVIENASVISGPMAGLMLADLGADVLKIENPDGGDQFRRWDTSTKVVNRAFATYNRGKRSITLNLRAEKGQEIYKALVRDADAVIENYRPGVMDARGIGFDDLIKVNPRLVYCDITGLGPDGPYKDRATFDGVAQAISGLWSCFVDMDNPEPVGPAMADQLTGLNAAAGVAYGLVSRSITGVGTKVGINMLSSAMSFIGSQFTNYLDDHVVPSKSDRSRASQTYSFLDSEGKAFAVHLSTPEKFWEGLCATAGVPEMAFDDRYNSKGKRTTRYDEIHETLAEIFTQRKRDAWVKALLAADVPVGALNTVAEAIEDPQIKHLRMFWDDAASGYSFVRSPIQNNGAFALTEQPTPDLGEHTDEVLSNLGYKVAEIREFHATGVV